MNEQDGALRADEIEAMASILGNEMWIDPSEPSHFCVHISPECDELTETVGSVALSVRLPQDYPSTSPASCTVQALDELAIEASSQLAPGFSKCWKPSAADREALMAVLVEATAERAGEPVVFDAVEAVRQWLEANTLAGKPAGEAEEAGGEAGEGEDESDDDLELDDEDMDGEMIEALRDVLRGDGKRQRELEEAAQLKEGSAEQRAALRRIWRGLTDGQRADMVASSDSDDEPPRATTGKASGGGGKAGGGKAGGGKQGVSNGGKAPPPAARSCPKGHDLTPVASKPAVNPDRHLS